MRMRGIFQQASWLFFAQIFTKIIGFFYTLILARLLGVEDFGLYAVGLAYFAIVSSLSDFGFNRFLTREIAISQSKVAELFSLVAALKLLIVTAIFVIFVLFISFTLQNNIKTSLIILSFLAVLPQTLGYTIEGIFAALRKLQFSAFSQIISSIITAALGIVLVKNNFGPIGAINALIVGQLIYAAVLFIFLWKNQGKLVIKINMSDIRQVVLSSLPYGILGILGFLYIKIDMIILSSLRGNFEAGIYGLSYKFLDAIVFIPSSFSVASFPVLARLHQAKSADLEKVFKKSVVIGAMAGIFISAVYILILPEIIKLFLPKYIQSIKAIMILSLSIPFLFIYAPLSQIILSAEKYLKELTAVCFCTLFFNIILNLLFIPKYGFVAAAWITVASEILSLVVVVLFIRLKIFKTKII